MPFGATPFSSRAPRRKGFGFDLIQSTLEASGRKVVVMNDAELSDDLVRDFVEIVTSMCARIYGKRSGKRKAERVLKALDES